MLLIVPALCIDALQAGLSMALAGVSAGAALIPVVGTAAAPIGILIGFVISVTLSLTFGWLVILLLGSQGMLYPKNAAMAFIGEGVPGFSLLPVWTGLVIFSYVRHMSEASAERSKVVGAISTAAALAMNPRMGAMRAAQNKTNFTAVQKAFRVGNETNAKTA